MNKKRLIIFISSVSVIALLFGYLKLTDKEKIIPVDAAAFMKSASEELSGYKLYLQKYKNARLPEGSMVDIVSDETTIPSGSQKEFTFSVQTTGMYLLSCEQRGGDDSVYKDKEFSLSIDGQLPFEECGCLYFPRRWVASEPRDTDINGNELRPVLAEQDEWYKSYAKNPTGYVSNPICFYLTAGNHVITLESGDLDLSFRKLCFEGYQTPEPYREPESFAANENARSIQIQAEDALYRSSPSILEQVDRSSAATIPVCSGADVYNTIGGSTWTDRGDSITWKFNVEYPGYYYMNMRALQDYAGGISSYRRLYIDGKIPFEEAQNISVPYSFKWQKITVTADDKPALFYLDRGPHTVTLECTLGEIEDLMEIVNNLLKDLNRAYRRVIMVISTNPDPYRDYFLKDKIPKVFDEMGRMSKLLEQISGLLYHQNKGSGSQTVLFERLCEQLKDFIKHPEKLQTELNYFQSNISAVGTWISERDSLPLELDWIEFVPAGTKSESKIDVDLLSKIKFSAERVVSSYVNDYNRFATAGALSDKSVDVWVRTGRDQVQIINQLCNEFAFEHGIGVRLKLIEQNTSVMMAVVAGTGPDVQIMGMGGEPVNYAVRKAVLGLTDMECFSEVIKDYHPEMLTPLTYMGETYALPETESFPVMFYRKDIFDELGLKVPVVWEDVYDLISDLQANNMQFGPYTDMYSLLLYQNGGLYYANQGEYSLLNSQSSVKAFKQWTRFFTDYGLPLAYDFLNRFRTGEVPIAIQDFGMYNSLVVFAPEIKNDWIMTMVPGTVREDGTVDHSINCGGTCAYIFSNCKDKDSSWKFLKWWVSGKTQGSFASQIEIMLGEQARYNVASISAFQNQMWSSQQSQVLSEQRRWMKGIPQVPGSYFLSRHLNNAFRKVVYNSADVLETLNEYTDVINKELTNKRKEFGIGEN